jgi:plasmid stability protein
MRKTSVYLPDEEADALRVFAESTGRSQADVIRDAVRRVVTAEGVPHRVFHSMGKGHGGGGGEVHWDADDLYAVRMGLRRPGDPQSSDVQPADRRNEE